MLRRIRTVLAGLEGSRPPLRHLSEPALTECRAQPAGVNLFRRGSPICSKWIVAAGVISDFTGSRFRRRQILCRVAADLRVIRLIVRLRRYFQWIEHAGIYISGALVRRSLTKTDGASGRCGPRATKELGENLIKAIPRCCTVSAPRRRPVCCRNARRLGEMLFSPQRFFAVSHRAAMLLVYILICAKNCSGDSSPATNRR